ncbi:MAG: hypothetical protein HY510_00285 [Acidobacteria bacterium]|nr:hypothetical protein [Acidobacteriota bacterium]
MDMKAEALAAEGRIRARVRETPVEPSPHLGRPGGAHVHLKLENLQYHWVLESLDGSVEVIACSPENSAVMHYSIRAGRILEMESKPTLSDGTAGVALAGCLKDRGRRGSGNVVVLCGANIARDRLKEIL